MASPVYLSNWGHGLGTLSVNGGGLTDYLSGSTISVQSAIKYSGSYAIKFDVTASTAYSRITLATPTHVCGQVRVYFETSLPTASTAVVWSNVTAGASLSVRYNKATDKLALYNGSTYVDMASVVADTWYRIDFDWDCSANPSTLKGKINGGTEQTHSVAQAATTFTNISIGVGATATAKVIIANLIASITAGDYPFEPIKIICLRTTSDGTHSNGANFLEDAAGSQIDGSSVFAYAQINKDPWTTETTTRIQQDGADQTKYVIANFENTTETSIVGAIALLQYGSATTSLNAAACGILDEDGAYQEIWGNFTTGADYSDTPWYKRKMLPAPAGGWDQAAVNALQVKIGGASDATPDPWWLNVIVEVAVVEVSSTPLVIQDTTQTQTIDNQVLIQHNVLAVANTAQAQTIANVGLTAHSILAIGDTAQAQAVDAPALTARSVLAIGDTVQAQATDNIVLIQHNVLAVADSAQAQAIDNVGLTAHSFLAIANVAQAQAVDNLVLTYHEGTGLSLTIQNSAQAQATDAFALVQHNVLTVADTAQIQVTDNLALVGHSFLAIADVTQAQASDAPALTTHSVLAIGDVSQGQVAENITLVPAGGGGAVLVIADVTQAQSIAALLLVFTTATSRRYRGWSFINVHPFVGIKHPMKYAGRKKGRR